MKDLSNHGLSQSYSAVKVQNMTTAAYQSNPGMDLIHARIEHLEKDRVELTLQLHRRDEKERDRKLKIDLTRQ